MEVARVSLRSGSDALPGNLGGQGFFVRECPGSGPGRRPIETGFGVCSPNGQARGCRSSSASSSRARA